MTMVSLSVSKDFIIVTFTDISVVFIKENGEYVERVLEHISRRDCKEELDQNEGSFNVCSSISSNSEYFTCSIHKDLYLWRVKDWILLSKRPINRSASAIVFSPKSDNIVIADKSGDVYLFSVVTPDSRGELILGHVSMLLNVLITPNSKYIVTCDRDEKIRVSWYPNAYNIESYCLGHDEFVTCICILPQNENILVSGGGDGTIRLWDFVCGKQLVCYGCTMTVSNETIDNNKPFITDIVSAKYTEQMSLLFVQCLSFKGIFIYCVSCNINNEFNCVFKESITLDSIPLCIKFCDNHLWIFKENLQETLSAYSYCTVNNEISFHNCLYSLNSLLNKHISHLENVFKKDKYPPTLYKRRFDNVQEYLKRKMMRIENDATKFKRQLSNSEVD